MTSAATLFQTAMGFAFFSFSLVSLFWSILLGGPKPASIYQSRLVWCWARPEYGPDQGWYRSLRATLFLMGTACRRISLRHSPRSGCAHICVMILRRRERERDWWPWSMKKVICGERDDGWIASPIGKRNPEILGELEKGEKAASPWENCFGIIKHRAHISLYHLIWVCGTLSLIQTILWMGDLEDEMMSPPPLQPWSSNWALHHVTWWLSISCFRDERDKIGSWFWTCNERERESESV